MDRNKRQLFCACCSITLATLLCYSPVVSAKSDTLEAQRKQFLEAEKSLQLGRLGRYQQLAKQLHDYPLYPYLRLTELTRSLNKASEKEVVAFLETYHDTPLADQLYQRWIHKLAKQGKVSLLIKHFKPTQNQALLCNYAMALVKDRQTQKAYEVLDQIWLTGKSLPKSCDAPLSYWQDNGQLTNDKIWARINLSMKNGQRRLASYLAKSLPQEERFWLSLWKKIQRNPDYIITADKHFGQQRSPVMHWILVDGMTRLSSRDPIRAADYWQEIENKYPFNAEEKERIERRLALGLVKAQTPLSDETLKSLELDISDERIITPHILSAIQDEDWTTALQWLNRLDPDEQQNQQWRYWRGRILEGMGRLEEARSVYLTITDNRSYYSFLATDRIGDRYQITHRPLNTPSHELQQLQVIPAVARAGELYQLNRMVEARREWYFAIVRMDKKQLLMAAQLANQWGWYDRSIQTLAHAQYWDDLELRFPLAHQKVIVQQAKKEQINPAWAFAVIRQESAFTSDARSSAGALGLMQLLPTTARQVARSLQIRRPRQRDLLDSNINIRLGIRFLSKLQRMFDNNKVLATAAYNAGQWRVKGWLPDKEPVSADLWVERVPFKETRDYLKRVLTYTVIYEQRLGLEKPSLLDRMPAIPSPTFEQATGLEDENEPTL